MHAEDGSAATPDIKTLVEAIITEQGFCDNRAAQMDQDDFLCLLAAFNARGIHFS